MDVKYFVDGKKLYICPLVSEVIYVPKCRDAKMFNRKEYRKHLISHNGHKEFRKVFNK